MMLIRAKAPLRLGLAGGGTDVSPYSDFYGGAVLNATISLFATATIEPLESGKIILDARDLDATVTYDSSEQLPYDGNLDLVKAVYNKVVEKYHHKPLSFRLTTYVDVPKGSGLGSSSTITVAVLAAFAEWLDIPFGEYEMAHLAYEIERIDLGLAGGKQDQYAATFGGFNFMEFTSENVIVNPLRVKEEYKDELQMNLLLYYLGTSRESAKIIEQQTANFGRKKAATLEAAHNLKSQATLMKDAILRGNIEAIGDLLHFGWLNKKQTATNVSNPQIDNIYEQAIQAGSTGGKISGAGGGGFMMFFAPGNARYEVMEVLDSLGAEMHPYQFIDSGVRSWKTR